MKNNALTDIKIIFITIVLIFCGMFYFNKSNHSQHFNFSSMGDETVIEDVKPVEPVPAPIVKSKKVATTDLSCLANNIFYEAGSESVEGKIAVANVTMNRVKTNNYPNSVCGVVYARNETTCAFSWTCDDKEDDVPKKSANYMESLKIANLALKGLLKDITDGADHFHADYVKPAWSRHMHATAQIGNHIFYRKKKADDLQ